MTYNSDCYILIRNEINADIQGASVLVKRFHHAKNYSSNLYKGIILQQLKQDFIPKIKSLLRDGKVGRRYLYEVLDKNNYFKAKIKDIVSTTEGPRLAPMTA